MGPGWGGTFGEGLGHSQRRTGHASTTFPLLRPFRAVPWRTVAALARPVTPEVAGSSPVAPVFEPPPCRHPLDERSGTYEERDGSNPSTSRAFSIAATTLFASEPESAAPASPWTTSVEQTTAREARRSDPVELGLLGDGDGREAWDRARASGTARLRRGRTRCCSASGSWHDAAAVRTCLRAATSGWDGHPSVHGHRGIDAVAPRGRRRVRTCSERAPAHPA